jgi:hypothetical protein
MTGANALALVRAFGGEDIAKLREPSGGDSTYFPALGLLVRYPGWLVWPFAILALIAVLALAVVVRRRLDIGYGRQAGGFGVAFIPLLLAPVLAQLLWPLLVAIRPGYANLIDPWQPGWYRAGVLALVLAVILTWYGVFRRRFGRWPLAVGALGWLAVLGLILAAATPGGSYLAALPALAGALAAIGAITLGRRAGETGRSAWAPAGVLTLGAAVAVIVLVPTVLLFFPALGLATGAAAALFATMLGLVLVPLLDPLFPASATAAVPTTPDPAVPATPDPAPSAAPDPAPSAAPHPAPSVAPGRATSVSARTAPRWRRALPGLVAGVLTVVLVGTGLAVDRFDAAHPAPAQLMYALDLDTGQARWVSGDVSPGPWVSGYVNATGRLGDEFPPLGTETLSYGPAQVAPLAPATVEAGPPTVNGTHRVYTLTIRPQRPVRLVYVTLPGTHALSATVDGRDVPVKDLAGDFAVLFHAPPAGGLKITVETEAAGPLKVRVMDGSDGLDGLPGYTPRPAGVGVRGSHASELVLVAKTYTI